MKINKQVFKKILDHKLFVKKLREDSQGTPLKMIDSLKCRFCDTEYDGKNMSTQHTYREDYICFVCDECKKNNKMQDEVLECQRIDWACNDCALFQRWDEIHKHLGHKWTCWKSWKTVYATPKTSRPNIYWPNDWYCWWKDFIHRKDF